MTVRWAIVLIAILSLVALANAFDLGRLISLDMVRENRASLLGFVADQKILAGLLFVAAYIAAVTFSVPGAAIISMTGGFMFGAWTGAALSVAGATAGATLLFLLVRSAFGHILAKRESSLAPRMVEGFRRNAFSYLLFLRLVPVFPFWGVNLAAAALGMPVAHFVVATFIGIIPVTTAYASFGASLGELFDSGGDLDMAVILSPPFFLGLVVLACLSLLPLAINCGGDQNRSSGNRR